MNNAILPKFLFTEEDVVALQDEGIQIQRGNQILNGIKVPCYKFFNMTETEVCDKLQRHPMSEATDAKQAQLDSYAMRVSSVLFLRLRQASAMRDKNEKLQAGCSLLAAVNSLALISPSYANRFVNLVRSLGS